MIKEVVYSKKELKKAKTSLQEERDQHAAQVAAHKEAVTALNLEKEALHEDHKRILAEQEAAKEELSKDMQKLKGTPQHTYTHTQNDTHTQKDTCHTC